MCTLRLDDARSCPCKKTIVDISKELTRFAKETFNPSPQSSFFLCAFAWEGSCLSLSLSLSLVFRDDGRGQAGGGVAVALLPRHAPVQDVWPAHLW